MANDTNNFMQELDAKVIAAFEASLSEEDKAEWQKARDKCGDDVKKIQSWSDSYRTAAYAFASGKVEYAYEQSGAHDQYESASISVQHLKEQRDKVLYGENHFFSKDVTGLDDVVNDKGEIIREGLRTKYNNAVERNDTVSMSELSKQIEARETELKTFDTELAQWTEKADSAYQLTEARDSKLDLLYALQHGNKEAVEEIMRKEIEAYDESGVVFDPTATPNINSASDGLAYQAKKAKYEEISSYKQYLGIEEPAEIQETAEVETTDYNGQLSDNTQTIDSEKPNPYDFDIRQPSGMPSSSFDNGTDNCYRASEQRRLERELNEQKATEVMNADGSINADKLNELSGQGYNIDSIKSIVDEKNKEKEGVSAEGQIAETAEAAEGEAKGAAPAEEKPNPYAFEKPDREADESDTDYENRCKLAEAEHIDSVNRQAAADINAGKYGNGEDRKKALAEAGLDYDAVQSIINNEYAPVYEAERAKQAEAAKQAAAVPSEADIDAALAEANDTTKIEVKNVDIKTDDVKAELDAIRKEAHDTVAPTSPEAEAQSIAYSVGKRLADGQPLPEGWQPDGYSEPMPEGDYSFEPIDNESKDDKAPPAPYRIPFGVAGEIQDYARTLERKVLEGKPVPEGWQNDGYTEPMPDGNFSFDDKDVDASKETPEFIPGVEYDKNGEAVVIHGDEPAPTQNDKKPDNKAIDKDWSKGTNLYNGPQADYKGAEYSN